MSASADRNLLFGILALQMDFITRDQLVEAMHAWVLAKQRPLGDILVEGGALAPADLALLAPMVGRHIAKHGGDPARSLAALNPPPAREALAPVADREVQASLCHLPQPKEPLEEFQSTIGSAPTALAGSRYRVERPHARGGLGVVFVARDQELNRKVALKHIQDQFADNAASRAQFLQEGEITGALEHPGIIPIYGLGQYADGRPFYAMRFVEGDSLRDAIERFHRPPESLAAGERNVFFRGLLGRFLDVCNAVAYAHDRGILHRDLKPGNVLLGEFGETLVIDWGMAKVLKSAGGERPPIGPSATTEPAPSARPAEPVVPEHQALATVGRGVHGTPGYMSPEQAEGRIDELGPATDIYSLGAILFHVLAGRPPLIREDGDVLGKTRRGDLPSVRQFQPQVSRSLEAICRKALALRPGERYASVQALAADVRRWLADEPVSAWREPWTVRGRRWLRKHPRLVAGAAAALLVGLLAALGGSALLDAKNRDLKNANTRLDVANTQLAQALADARAARRRADERTRLANERFALALETFKQQVFDVNRILESRSGTQELRKTILARAVVDLQKLAREGEKTQEADRTRAAAHSMLGDIYLNLDGRVRAARHEYELAHGMFKRLATAVPTDAQAQRDLAISFDRLGDVLRQQEEIGAALERYREGLRIRQRLATAAPSEARAQGDLFASFHKIGSILLQQGERRKALEHYRESLHIARRLAAVSPQDLQAERDVASSLNHIGDVLLRQDEPRKAEEHYREGLRISRRRAAADPGNTETQRDLSISFGKLGDALLQRGEVEKAREQYRESLRIAQHLAAADPHNFQAQTDLVIGHYRIGRSERRAIRPLEAAAAFEKGLAVLRSLQQAGKLKGTRFATWPGQLEGELAFCRAARTALGDLDGLLELPEEQAVFLLALRAQLLSQQAKYPEAATAADKLATLAKGADRLFLTAAVFGWCSRDRANVDRHAARSLSWLRKARDAGFFKDSKNLERLRKDEAFQPLRDRADFKKLLADLAGGAVR